MLIGNVTSDPYADVVIFSRCGVGCSRLYVLKNTNGSFQAPGAYWWQSTSFTWENAKPLSTADYVSADGIGDLIVLYQNSSGTIDLFMYGSNGTSAFAWPTIPWSSPAGEDYSQVLSSGSSTGTNGDLYFLRREAAKGRTRPERLQRQNSGSSSTFTRTISTAIYNP